MLRALILVVGMMVGCAAGLPAYRGERAVLPLTFTAGLPEVVVARPGQPPLSLMLDLGAFAGVALATPHLDGVRFVGETRRFTDARGVAHTARRFVVPEVRLGDVAFIDVAGQELVFAPDFAPPNRDGYVGRPLLAQHRVLIDYASARVLLFGGPTQAEERDFIARAGAPIAIEVSGDGVVVAATVDGVARRLVLDTGATHSTLRPAIAPGALAIGEHVWPRLPWVRADVGPPGVDGMLGTSFFAAQAVLLDLRGGTLWIAR